jgi:hypothetical protein
MNLNQLIQWANEAMPEIAHNITHDELKRFAELVAAHEREACARACEMQKIAKSPQEIWNIAVNWCKHAIEARGQNEQT